MSKPSPKTYLSRDGAVFYFPNALAGLEWNRLESEIDWVREEILMFGRRIKVPRKTAYYGEYSYRYSGTDHSARELPRVLMEIKERISGTTSDHTDVTFNSVLCNRYQNGSDSMGWHRDNEREIDTKCIASVSFGGTRRFKLRHRESREVVSIDLGSGSLLLMIDCQEAWEHELPKTKRLVEARINLTFRRVVPIEN